MNATREDQPGSELLGLIFPGESEMARRMRALDWSGTDLGPPSTWHENLRTAVSICLTSRFPIVLWWGPDLTLLYNDAYVPLLGPGKHPHWLGRSGRDCWSEIWETVGPMLDGVMRSGRATWSEELLLVLNRHLPREECYFTFSYSPILTADASTVGGIFCAVTETTEYVLGRRRVGTLHGLGRRLTNLETPESACVRAAQVLDANPHDVPFAAFYLIQPADDEALRVASVRVEPGSKRLPERVRLDDESVWPLGSVWRSRRAEEVALPPEFPTSPGGSWPEPARQAIVLPIAAPGFETPGGVLVLGVSPRRMLDAAYRDFFLSIATQTGAAIAEALAYEAERKRAEALAELDRAKTAFFSNVSHEFRTPLTLLLGPLEDALTERDEALGARTAERLAVAQRNGLRLLKLVNTLLDFSRIEAGRIEATYEETDLGAYTTELASVFRSAVERAGLTLEISCRKVEAPVFVDREMWEKVILNLLSNAFKFTLRGGIRVTVREDGANAVVAVRDTGTGIPSAELPHVFERFHRVRGAIARTHEGTGIGLALVQELVKLHGGSVAAESELGSGTTFTVTLPTGSAHLPADRIGASRTLVSTALGAAPYVEEALRWLPDEGAPAALALADATAVGVSTSGARVLVADDNRDMREYLRRVLAAHWDVDAVADGEAALAAIRGAPPDLVLADVMMPRLDGFALLETVRADPATRTLPVVLLSARAGEESRVEGLDAGADDYLVKPFSAREFVARINAHLEIARRRRDYEQGLRESEERFRVLADSAPALIWVNGVEGCEFVNRGYLEFLGVDPAEVRGEDWARFVHPEDRDAYVDAYRRAMELRAPFEAEFRFRRHDGEYRWMRSVGQPRLGPDRRKWLGCVGLTVDVTEHKRAEAEREALLRAAERARGEAEAANRAKDDFLAVLSHELRAPMNAIVGWLRILRSAGTRDPDLARRAADTLERNVWIQAQVIDDLLDVSRILSGKLQLDRERVEFCALVQACVESFRPPADGKRIALRLDVDAPELHLLGDAARLQQVVSNLVGNAIKFTDSGGSIVVRVRRRNGLASLVVEDDGQGIAPEFLPHLFERFRQADASSTRRHGGLGLGLSIVKNLVALHGGEVHAESAGVGCGARFSVLLPLVEAPARQPFRAAAAEPARVGEPLPALDVLLVDDDPDTRDALELVLRSKGLRVRSAASVRQALDAHAARPPDVLITDIGMPGEDGYVLIRAIREREERLGRRTLAIAMTGFAGRQDREMALRAGFDDHVAKPIEPDAIMERVRVLVASRGHEFHGRSFGLRPLP